MNRIPNIRVSWNKLQGVDPVTRRSYHDMFADRSLHVKMGMGFSQEPEIRQYSIAGVPNNDSSVGGGNTLVEYGRI